MNCFNPNMTELNCPLTFKSEEMWRKNEGSSVRLRDRGGGDGDGEVASGLKKAEGVEGVWVYRKPDRAALKSGEVIMQLHGTDQTALEYPPYTAHYTELACTLHLPSRTVPSFFQLNRERTVALQPWNEMVRGAADASIQITNLALVNLWIWVVSSQTITVQ